MDRDIRFVKGDTIAFTMSFTGLEEDLTDAYFSAKKSLSDEDYAFQVKLNDGISKVEDTNEYLVTVPADVTKKLEPRGYYYDLVIVIGSTVNTLLKGILTIEKNVTDV